MANLGPERDLDFLKNQRQISAEFRRGKASLYRLHPGLLLERSRPWQRKNRLSQRRPLVCRSQVPHSRISRLPSPNNPLRVRWANPQRVAASLCRYSAVEKEKGSYEVLMRAFFFVNYEIPTLD